MLLFASWPAPQRLDQHASFELNSNGKRTCERVGAAVDLHVPGTRASQVVAQVRRQPFDRIYFYGDDRPVHVSWSSTPVGYVTSMVPSATDRRVPRRV